MKNVLLLCLLALLTAFPVRQTAAQKITTATEYNDYIIGLQGEIGEAVVSFNSLLDAEDASYEKVVREWQSLNKVTQSSVDRLSRMSGWDNSTELRDKALALFQFYQRTFKNDYKEMIDILYKRENASQDPNRLAEILDKVSTNEEDYDERFQTAQEAFAKKYGFTMKPNELQEELNGE